MNLTPEQIDQLRGTRIDCEIASVYESKPEGKPKTKKFGDNSPLFWWRHIGFGEWLPNEQWGSSDAKALELLADFLPTHHWTLKTPFAKHGPYHAGMTPLGTTGWNGRPDIEASGETLALAICRCWLKGMLAKSQESASQTAHSN